MNFSPKQAKALDAITAWLRDPNGKQTFYLAGVAGSDKSNKHAVVDVRGMARRLVVRSEKQLLHYRRMAS